MRHGKRSALLGLGSIALTGILVATFFFRAAPSAGAAGGTLEISSTQLKALGTTSIQGTVHGATQGSFNLEISPATQMERDDEGDTGHPPAGGPTTPSNPRGNGVTSTNVGFSGFAGINHFDQRFADNGNQFSTEPPDQGLCVGNGYVLEAVNTALAVYRADTHALVSGPTALNPFLKLPSALDRTHIVYGPDLTDPKCYFDASVNRWFISILELDLDPAGGFLTGPTHEYLAVSQTGDPTGAFSVFSFSLTDDGTEGTPTHTGCPCVGDQPLIGADAYGFYISTNEFPLFANGFNGAQLYSISKHKLVQAAQANSGTLPTVTHMDVGEGLATPDPDGIWGSVQPATSPRLEGHEPNNGTEYFLSSLDFFNTLDNRIATWALTNTRSLDSSHPDLHLSLVVSKSEVYGAPPDGVVQKTGPTPLADFIAANGDPVQAFEHIAGNDDRMNQVVFADGLLWGAVNTVVGSSSAPRAGIAYFIVQPGWEHGHLAARVAGQGYVSLAGNNVLFPSIGVNAHGQAVIGFSISGPDFYPSAAYAELHEDGHAGKVHIAGAGLGPEDGFTGYVSPTVVGFVAPDPGVSRWGDYSAAVAAANGSIWFAAEYIGQTCTDAQFNADTSCGGTRSALANWGTFISNVFPGHDD